MKGIYRWKVRTRPRRNVFLGETSSQDVQRVARLLILVSRIMTSASVSFASCSNCCLKLL